MREFTPEEKELIVNTPITIECFDLSTERRSIPILCKNETVTISLGLCYEDLIEGLESLRIDYLGTRNEMYFEELVRLLPNSYKVVKL